MICFYHYPFSQLCDLKPDGAVFSFLSHYFQNFCHYYYRHFQDKKISHFIFLC